MRSRRIDPPPPRRSGRHEDPGSAGPRSPPSADDASVLRTRRLGSSGPDITLIGLGTWAVGGPYEFGWGPVDDRESVAAIRHGIESGVNWIDTAPVYGLGHSEEVVGLAVEPYRVGEDVFVFTKCGRK